MSHLIHGDGLESIRTGFDELAMPSNRRNDAYALVAEVLKVNEAVVFCWYKTKGTEELACYWDDHETNVLWVTVGHVHIQKDSASVRRPTEAEVARGPLSRDVHEPCLDTAR